MPSLTETMDFPYLNGPRTLSLEGRSIEAINDAHFCYQNHLSYIQSNPLYYIAVMLDPTAKHERLYRTMNVDEFTLRRNAVASFISSYLSEENSTSCKDQDAAQVSSEEEVRDDNYRSFNVHEQPRLAQLPESESSATNDDNAVIKEWHEYQKEPIIYGKSRKEAITWWYKHRRSYPCLFKLAMALFYTKLSSCDVERCFSLAGRVIRKDRARLHKNNAVHS